MKRILTGAAIALIVIGTEASAQSPFSIDVRAGAAFSTEDYGTVDLGTGFGFEAAVRYRFMPHLGVYAGWSWYHFSPEDQLDLLGEVDVEETGYSAGLLFEHPLTSTLTGWVRGGGVYAHTELEVDGEDGGETDHGFGWEAGAGLGFALTPKLSLMPGVRYRSFEPDVADLDDDPTMSYVAAELGLSWRL